MSDKIKTTDHKETRRLLLVVDDEGTNLTRREIDFVADLIDRWVMTFSEKEAAKIRKIHHKRVVNGKPERD